MTRGLTDGAVSTKGSSPLPLLPFAGPPRSPTDLPELARLSPGRWTLVKCQPLMLQVGLLDIVEVIIIGGVHEVGPTSHIYRSFSTRRCWFVTLLRLPIQSKNSSISGTQLLIPLPPPPDLGQLLAQTFFSVAETATLLSFCKLSEQRTGTLFMDGHLAVFLSLLQSCRCAIVI